MANNCSFKNMKVAKIVDNFNVFDHLLSWTMI